ncbi:MAG: DUF2080 family transposase-associated protein [Nanoarchaeota archaeon]
MESITKKTREVGTSAGVLLPRSWLNRQVVVTLFEPSKEKILQDIARYLFSHNLNEEVKGVYLFGSYARGEQDFESDIDILIITDNINKLAYFENYEIILVSESSFSKNLEGNLNYLSALNEAKVLLNKDLIEKYKARKPKIKVKKFLAEIKRVLKINKETLETCNIQPINVPDGVVYSLVLRLRELYIIKAILSGKEYSKRDFLRFIDDKIYSAYLRVKRNEKEVNIISANELKNIVDLSEKWLIELND